MWAVGDRASGLALTRAEEFASLAALKVYARGSHEELDRFVATATDARLEERISMPWFTDPPLSISVAEAVTQCAMHSHYHRGQNATRLAPRRLRAALRPRLWPSLFRLCACLGSRAWAL